MADLVTPSNCPIRYEKDGTCMCAIRKCADVEKEHCSWMRSAYTYGATVMENKANELINKIHEGIEVLFPKDGEQDG